MDADFVRGRQDLIECICALAQLLQPRIEAGYVSSDASKCAKSKTPSSHAQPQVTSKLRLVGPLRPLPVHAEAQELIVERLEVIGHMYDLPARRESPGGYRTVRTVPSRAIWTPYELLAGSAGGSSSRRLVRGRPEAARARLHHHVPA